MVNVIIILPLTLSQHSLCELSSNAQICFSLRDDFSVFNPICHATFTLCTTSNNKIIFHWIKTVVTAWKPPAGWWETKTLKKPRKVDSEENMEKNYVANRCTDKQPHSLVVWTVFLPHGFT